MYTRKNYAHEIAAVNLSKIYFPKNAKKTCKPNNGDLKSRLNKLDVEKAYYTMYRPYFLIYYGHQCYLSKPKNGYSQGKLGTVPFKC